MYFPIFKANLKPIKSKERKKWLKQYPELKKYQRSLESLDSKIRCITQVIRYCKFIGKNPKELVGYTPKTKEVKREKASDWLDDFCNEYLDWIEEYPEKKDVLSINSMAGLVGSVRGLYRENRLELPTSVGRQIFKRVPKEWDTSTPNRKDIENYRKLMLCDRDKLAVHFDSTIPLRKNELRQLKWEDIKDFSEEYPYIILPYYRLKGKYRGVWFIGIVCKSLKEELIKWKKELQTRFAKYKLKWSDSNHIFMTRIGIPRLMNRGAFNNLFVRASKEFKRKYHFKVTLHDFRRYFESYLDKAVRDGVEVPRNYRYWMLGHQLEGVSFHYNQVEAHIPNIIEMFKELEPYLDIDLPEPTESKYQKLEREKGELLKEVKELRIMIRRLTEELKKTKI